MRVNVFVSMIVAAGLATASSIALAQNATAPARETPRPQDIDPAVNTSATPPARETPRPQDIEPRVNTSAPSQSPSASQAASRSSQAAPGDTGGAAASAAAPGATSSSTPTTASGARASRAAGAASNANATGNAGAAPGADAGKPAGSKGKALDRLELDTTQITGNRELPKVLYIVPWKRSDLGDLVGKPVNSLLDEVLTPVDRDVFQRENRYYRALTPGAAANDASSTPDARPATSARRPAPANGAQAPGSPGSATSPGNGVSTGSGSAAPAPRDEK